MLYCRATDLAPHLPGHGFPEWKCQGKLQVKTTTINHNGSGFKFFNYQYHQYCFPSTATNTAIIHYKDIQLEM